MFRYFELITIASSPFFLLFVFWLIRLIKNRGSNKIGQRKFTKKKKKEKKTWFGRKKKDSGADGPVAEMKSIAVGVRQKGKDH